MKKILLAVCLLEAVVSLQAQNPRYSSEIEARIKQVENNLGEAIKTSEDPINLLERMKEYGIAGVSIAVIHNNKLEWARAYGFADVEKKRPATTSTLFQAASISKSVNAMGVMKLVQAGKLNLDADINTYLKSWKFPYDSVSKNKIITIRQLLSHTAGTSVHGFGGYTLTEAVPTITQILNGEKPANSAAVRSILEPGEKVQYSGGGTTITQQIVMDQTGQAYDAYMKAQVLTPLGMRTSYYSMKAPANATGLQATGYRENGKPIEGGYHLYPEQAAASLWTNPTELSAFITEIQRAYAGKSDKILNKATVTTMLSPVKDGVGLGFFIKTVAQDRYFSHGGANEGFRSIYIASEDGSRGAVVMVNSDNGAIMNEIVHSVATVYGWKDFYKPVFKKTIKVPNEILDSYVGVYQLGPDFDLTVKRVGDQLMVEPTNQQILVLHAEEQARFFVKEVEATIEFVKDDTGKVFKMIVHQNGSARDAPKK